LWHALSMATTATLERAIEGWERRGHWPHAVLLTGGERAGVFAAAQRVAARRLCAEPPPGVSACGTCPTCARLARGSHLDLHVLSSSATADELSLPHDGGDGKLRAMITKDEVLNLCRQLSLRAHEGGWRVVLVLRPEEMNPAAANAFLKTLEEPGERTLFLLASARPKILLDTVISRCQQVALPPPTHAQLSAILIEEGVDAELAPVLAELDRRGESIGEELLRSARPLAIDWVTACAAGDRLADLRCAEAYAKLGPADPLLGLLSTVVEDAARAAAGVGVERLTHGDLVDRLHALPPRHFVEVATFLRRSRAALRRNVGLLAILVAATRGMRLE
jgi:DNA polymerase-3 subunit delta'